MNYTFVYINKTNKEKIATWQNIRKKLKLKLRK